SVMVTVNDSAPASVGVPVSAPSAVSCSPVGSAPAVTANEYGPVPPPPVSVRAYAAPAPAPGSDAGESVTTGQLTVNEALVRLSAPLAATSCMAPGPLTTRLANVETPSESPTTAPLPVSAPEPTSDSETGRPGTGLPNASAARTRTAGVIAAPAATFVGC